MKIRPIEDPLPMGTLENPPLLTARLLMTSAVSTLAGGFHFGYLISAVNPLAAILQEFIVDNLRIRYSLTLTASQVGLIWSTLVGSLFIGAMIGAYLSISLIPSIGPRKTLLLSSILLLGSAPLFGFGYVFDLAELLPISRVVSGVAFAIGLSAQGVFLTEISPAQYRGAANTLTTLIGNFAFLLAAVLGTPYLLGTPTSWHIIFFLETIPSLLHILINCLYFHDSPNYLLSIGKSVAAEASLKAYYGKSCHVKRILEGLRNRDLEVKREKTLREMLRDGSCVQALSLSVAINFSVAFSGIVAISLFGTFLLQTVGFSPEGSAVANSLCSISSIISALLATVAFDKIGRRPLLIGSLISLSLINILMMSLVFFFDSTKNADLAWPFLALFVLFNFVFSIGIGPAAIFIGAELAPPGTISKMQSYSTSVQFIGSFICPIIYMSLVESIGGFSFLLFIVPLTITAAYFYMYLPETKGKTSSEINELLRNRK